MKSIRKPIAAALICLAISTAVHAENSDPMMDFWGAYDPHKDALNSETIREWETEKGVFRIVRFDLGKLEGTNRKASPKVAAYFGFPKGEGKVPGIVHIHGGGQRADKTRVESWVELGFACVSINWGGLPLENDGGRNTDWDGLAAGFLREGVARGAGLDHHDTVRPDPHTLYKEPHLLNSSWNLIALAARRALTFLEGQEEVDGSRLGIEGHSMGGRSTVLSSIDPRVKASSPSVGGSGFLTEDIAGLPGSRRPMKAEDGLSLYRQVVSAESYWPHIKAPVLFLGSTNDFNSPTEFVVNAMSGLPASTERMLALAPHLNHRFDKGTDSARFLWMIAHLKGGFRFPKSSPAGLELKTEDHVPLFTVTPDRTAGLEIRSVEIYYSCGRDPRVRFWNSAEVTESGGSYSAPCPVFDVNEPLFAFANITYASGLTLPRRPGVAESDIVTVTSEYQIVQAGELAKAGVIATRTRERLVDDFSHGMRDWYQLNPDNREHWFYATRKLIDPAFMGPKGAKLAFDVVTTAPGNRLAVGLELNTWQNYTGRKQDSYHTIVNLPEDGVNKVELSPADFRNKAGESPGDWDEVTELTLTPSRRVVDVPEAEWKGNAPELANLRWIGGEDGPRPYPHESRGGKAAADDREEFNKAIERSVERENLDKEAVAAITPPELWAGYDPDKGDFKEEIVSEKTEDGIMMRDSYISAYVLGEEIRVYCRYAVKAGATRVPGLMDVHGWMSKPNPDLAYVRNGWAVMAHDYCGKTGDRPHFTKYPAPLRYGNMDQNEGHRVKSTTPDGKQITDPRQTDDYLWYAIQRRVLSYLLAQREVDAGRIGAKGYSYGGTLMWNLAMDKRVKAVVSYFGIGWLEYYRTKRVWLYADPKTHAEKTSGERIYLDAIAPQAHAPYIGAACLWLNGSNDHHGGHERGEQTFRMFKEGVPWDFAHQARGHHNTEKLGDDCRLWLEKHVLGKNLFWPERPQAEIRIGDDGVPELRVTPASPERVKSLEIYFAKKDLVSFSRVWEDAPAASDGKVWTARLPVSDVNDYVFAFANITYESDGSKLVVSTDFQAAVPSELGDAVATAAAGAKADFGGWTDVAPVEGAGGVLGFRAMDEKAGTRNPDFGKGEAAPPGAKLVFRFYCTQPQKLRFIANGKFEAEILIGASNEWQSAELEASRFTDASNGGKMAGWADAKELAILPGNGADITKVIFTGFGWKAPATGGIPDPDGTGRIHLNVKMASEATGFWRLVDNASVSGAPVRIGGKEFTNGIGVHADSQLRFALGGRFSKFHVIPGPDDSHHGDLEMKVLVDGKEVFSTGKTNSREKVERRPLEISVKGAQELTLAVGSLGERGGDHASWAEAWLAP